MRNLGVLILAMMAAVVGTTVAVDHPWWPDLVLALIAWIAVTDPGMSPVFRCWLVGLMADAVDPGSVMAHSLVAVVAGTGLLMARPLLGVGMVVPCALAALILVAFDRLAVGILVNGAALAPGDVLATASVTALASAVLAMVSGRLVRGPQLTTMIDG